jgi:hypothetical protein
MTTRFTVPVAVVLMTLGWVEAGIAAPISELLEHPNGDVARFYQENEATVDALYRTITENAQPEARADAFRMLVADYPQAAEVIAREFVTDSDIAIALGAIGVLEQALVMSDHDMGGHEHADPLITHMMASHEAGRAALRTALTDERPEVRERVAPYLASLSDEPALQAIVEATASGLYSDAEAADIVSLAGMRLQAEYLPSFLMSEDSAAQRTAITYLGFNPEYQSVIRDAYLIDSAAEPATRVVAAEVLSRYDPSYPQYAGLVFNQEGIDPQVYAALVGGYVGALARTNELTPGIAEAISAEVRSFSAGLEVDLPVLRDIELLDERLNSIIEFQ